MGCPMRNCVFGHMRRAKTEVSLHTRTVCSEPSFFFFQGRGGGRGGGFMALSRIF